MAYKNIEDKRACDIRYKKKLKETIKLDPEKYKKHLEKKRIENEKYNKKRYENETNKQKTREKDREYYKKNIKEKREKRREYYHRTKFKRAGAIKLSRDNCRPYRKLSQLNRAFAAGRIGFDEYFSKFNEVMSWIDVKFG